MTKEQLFRNLYKSMVTRNEYIDKIPNDISGAFFDNEYVNTFYIDINEMLTYIFGDASESINWFLYDWHPGYEVGSGNIEKQINNIDEYIDWMKNVENVDLS